MTEKSDLERTQELFDFLQGKVPKGYEIAEQGVPQLTEYQAWTVIWYLGNQYWQVPDHVERCGVCGNLFDRHSEGMCLDDGEAPFLFCDGCMCSDEYAIKSSQQPSRNPAPSRREQSV